MDITYNISGDTADIIGKNTTEITRTFTALLNTSSISTFLAQSNCTVTSTSVAVQYIYTDTSTSSTSSSPLQFGTSTTINQVSLEQINGMIRNILVSNLILIFREKK